MNVFGFAPGRRARCEVNIPRGTACEIIFSSSLGGCNNDGRELTNACGTDAGGPVRKFSRDVKIGLNNLGTVFVRGMWVRRRCVCNTWGGYYYGTSYKQPKRRTQDARGGRYRTHDSLQQRLSGREFSTFGLHGRQCLRHQHTRPVSTT